MKSTFMTCYVVESAIASFKNSIMPAPAQSVCEQLRISTWSSPLCIFNVFISLSPPPPSSFPSPLSTPISLP